MALIEEKMGAKMDPDFLKSVAYAAYESVYGEAEARNVQRRFSDFRKAKLNPVETRRADAPDDDITMSEDAAAEAAADMVRESLEYGDYSYEEVFPDAFKAKGGVISLADVARNVGRGPRGLAALAPIARNMNRPMVS